MRSSAPSPSTLRPSAGARYRSNSSSTAWYDLRNAGSSAARSRNPWSTHLRNSLGLLSHLRQSTESSRRNSCPVVGGQLNRKLSARSASRRRGAGSVGATSSGNSVFGIGGSVLLDRVQEIHRLLVARARLEAQAIAHL